MADRKLTLDIFARDRGAKRTLEGVGDAAEDAGDELRSMGDASKKLDADIAKTQGRLRSLATELSRTDRGSAAFSNLRKEFNAANRDLSQMSRWRKTFSDAGDQAGQGFVLRFVGRLGPAMASAPIKTPLIVAAAAAGPQIAAALSAAVTGGIAVGAVAAGAKLAARNAEVEKAFSSLGKDVMEGLTLDAKPMVQPLLDGAAQLRAEFGRLRPELQGIFTKSASYVPILTSAVADGAHEIVGDLREVVDNAEPVVDVLGKHIPRAAATTGSVLKLLSADAAATAGQLDALLTGAEVLAGQSGTGLFLLNQAAKYTTSWQAALVSKLGEGAEKEREAASAAEELAREQNRAGLAVRRTAEEINALNDALSNAPTEALAAEEAALAMQQSYRDLNKTLEENGKQHKQGSAKALENKAALLDYAGSVQSAAEAARVQTGSQAAANNVLDAGRTKFLKAADAAGIQARAAKNLADKLFGIPGKRQTDITVNKQQAERDLNRFNSRANSAARNRNMHISVSWDNPRNPLLEAAKAQAGRRHTGGGTSARRSYWVGERGPELLTMGNSPGHVTPTHRLGGAGGGGGQVLELRLAGAAGGLEKVFLSWLQGALRGNPGVRIVTG